MSSVLLTFFLLGNLAFAQGSIEVNSINVSYTFGKELKLTAQIQSGDPIQDVQVFFQPEGDSVYAGYVSPDPAGQVSYRFDLSQQPFSPFTTINYWIKVRDQGSEWTTPTQSFFYADNRFSWKTVNTQNVNIHWYSGTDDLGNEAEKIIGTGLASINKFLPSVGSTQYDVYLYTSRTDIEDALRFSGMPSISGLSLPEQETSLILAEPGEAQSIDLRQRLPHELMHLVLYSNYPNAYAKFPNYLVEGLASFVELSPDPNYSTSLLVNKKSNSLIPIEKLCSTFPRDHSTGLLAYAESASFVNYLYATYGANGLQRLTQSYSSGVGCLAGIRQAFNISLSDLDQRWQKSLDPSPATQPFPGEIVPYLLLTFVVLAMPLSIALIRKSGRKI